MSLVMVDFFLAITLELIVFIFELSIIFD